MGKKKENILDYLATGKEEILSWKNRYGESNSEVHIATATGHYNFPPTYEDKYGVEHDYKEELLRVWNRHSRELDNPESMKIHRTGLDKLNMKSFGESMLYLRDHPGDARIYAAIFETSKLVMPCLRPYLYQELCNWARVACVQRDGGKSMSSPVPFETAERMPQAFRKGWEEIDLSGFDIMDALKRLSPKFRKGERVYVDGYGEGPITRVFAVMDKHFKYHIRYEIDRNGSYWGHRTEEEKHISPIHAMAV